MTIYQHCAVDRAIRDTVYSVGTIPTAAQVQEMLRAMTAANRMCWSHSFMLQGPGWSSAANSVQRFVLPVWYSGWGALRVNRGASAMSLLGTLRFREWGSGTSLYYTTWASGPAAYWPTDLAYASTGIWATVGGCSQAPTTPNDVVEIEISGTAMTGPYGITFYRQPVVDPTQLSQLLAFRARTNAQIPVVPAGSGDTLANPMGTGLLRQMWALWQAARERPVVLGTLPHLAYTYNRDLGYTDDALIWADPHIAQAFNRWIPCRFDSSTPGWQALWVVTDSDPSIELVVGVGGQTVRVRSEAVHHATRTISGTTWHQDLYVCLLDIELVKSGAWGDLIRTWVRGTKIRSLSVWLGGIPHGF